MSSSLANSAFALLAIVCLASQTIEALEVVRDLKFLTVIFRHGYRATAYTYKNDPYGEKIWPSGFSSLTTKGVQQHYRLGQFLKKRYAGYIDPARAVREVYVRSTNYDRTIQSAMANMAGWFPPTPTDNWDSNLLLGKLWRPFPVRLSDDPTLLGETDCQRIDARPYRPDLQRIFNAIELEHKVILDYIRENSGELNLTVARGLEQVSDVLRCQKYAGFKLPAWVNETVYEKIQYLDDLRFHIWVGGNGDVQRARINGGKLLKHFLDDFQNKINNVTDAAKRKAYVYASHDNSIGGLLSTLDLYDYSLTGPIMHIPLYANTLFFELYNNNTVRILHKNDTTSANFADIDPIVLTHPQCTTYCPLEKLIQLTAEYVPESANKWMQECEDLSKETFVVKRLVRLPK